MVKLTAISHADRFDVGLFFAQDGGDGIVGNCSKQMLSVRVSCDSKLRLSDFCLRHLQPVCDPASSADCGSNGAPPFFNGDNGVCVRAVRVSHLMSCLVQTDCCGDLKGKSTVKFEAEPVTAGSSSLVLHVAFVTCVLAVCYPSRNGKIALSVCVSWKVPGSSFAPLDELSFRHDASHECNRRPQPSLPQRQ